MSIALPKGKTCADCIYFYRCTVLRCTSSEKTVCYFPTSRYKPKEKA